MCPQIRMEALPEDFIFWQIVGVTWQVREVLNRLANTYGRHLTAEMHVFDPEPKIHSSYKSPFNRVYDKVKMQFPAKVLLAWEAEMKAHRAQQKRKGKGK